MMLTKIIVIFFGGPVQMETQVIRAMYFAHVMEKTHAKPGTMFVVDQEEKESLAT